MNYYDELSFGDLFKRPDPENVYPIGWQPRWWEAATTVRPLFWSMLEKMERVFALELASLLLKLVPQVRFKGTQRIYKPTLLWLECGIFRTKALRIYPPQVELHKTAGCVAKYQNLVRFLFAFFRAPSKM